SLTFLVSFSSTDPSSLYIYSLSLHDALPIFASVFRGAEEVSTNAELKACDASCNPYLALGGLIAAGLDGLERGLEPPEPVDVDPATIDEAERERRGIVRLPATQAEALDALERDELLVGALGPVLAASYLAVRRSEWAAYSAGD